ncbi:MAG TPA: cation:proton antiporter [Acidimicrobiia bacterium]|nr:cation:proton antiporter [Acidimicrobiia bacterium]
MVELRVSVELALLVLTALILIGPLLAERVRIPGLIGLIFLGTVFGPYVLNGLRPGGLVATIGAIGLLYLMFLAGIELDIKAFMENRAAAVTFGLLTFAIPFVASLGVGLFYLDYPLASAALVGAMWSSHTLVAYPEVKSAGLSSSRAVGSAVAATVITDILSLLILGVATASAVDTTRSAEPSLFPLWVGVPAVIGFCLWVLPRLAEWFFTSVGRTRTQRFVFCLAGMAAGATVGMMGGIEGLVGAFLAGIGLNRLVPARSSLMEHIEFFGGALFVPAFLVSVGLSIDPSSMFQASTVLLALVFISVVLITKTIAAFISGRIFGYSFAESGLMASLTIGQAAATLAIARVGVEVGMFTQQVMNASVLTLVIAVLITSLGTRRFARRIDIAGMAEARLGSHILIDASRGGTDGLIRIGVAIARGDGGIVTPFAIRETGEDNAHHEHLSGAIDQAQRLGSDTEGVKRVGGSWVSGTVELSVETEASLVLVPWDVPRFASLTAGHRSAVDDLGASSPVPVAAAHFTARDWERVVVVTGRLRSWPARTADAALAIEMGRRVASYCDVSLLVFASDGAVEPGMNGEVETRRYRPGTGDVVGEILPTDLLVIPSHVVAEASILAAERIQRIASRTSVLVVAGPGRLRTLSGWAPDQLAGVIGLRSRITTEGMERIHR